MTTLVRSFIFSLIVNTLLFWAYFTWDLYRSNQEYVEFLKVIQQHLSENPEGQLSIVYWSSPTYTSILWYGLVTVPFFMGVYLLYKKRFSTV